ncbi:MAG: hypothetical protein Ta2B_15820 [Termitinemataceae bacterium]|nr:MAG: hypothetical protein Ta2B_15820 [Termitinemataceae bacterium]
MLVQINKSALRHGVAENDIYQALATVIFGSFAPQFSNVTLQRLARETPRVQKVLNPTA